MDKTVKQPKTHIVSCRVSDQEMEFLQNLAQDAGTNISSLLRLRLELAEPIRSGAGGAKA